MTTDTNNRVVDYGGTIFADASAMRVREALLALLRSWEDMHNLPRSVPTRAERGLERGGRAEFGPVHHQRGGPDDS